MTVGAERREGVRLHGNQVHDRANGRWFVYTFGSTSAFLKLVSSAHSCTLISGVVAMEVFGVASLPLCNGKGLRSGELPIDELDAAKRGEQDLLNGR